MALVENNDVIQTLSSNAADNALDIRVLPRTPWCDGTFFHSQPADPFSKMTSIDGIAITQQVFRRRLPGKGFDKLLRRPLGSWMLRRIKVDNPPSIMGQDDERE